MAVGLGGGRNPGFALVIGLASASALAFAVSQPPRTPDWAVDVLGWIALGVFALLALVQLVPLGAATWAGLPGRDLPAGISALVGAHGSHPLSLDPAATLSSLVAGLPALAMFIATLNATTSERRVLGWVIVAAATFSVLLGACQVAGGDDFYLFSSTHFGYPVGLLANRNHQADLLLVAMLLLAGIVARDSHRGSGRHALLIAGMSLFAIGVVTSGSRVGIALLPFVAVGILSILVGGDAERRIRRIAAACAVIALAALLVLWLSPAAQDRVARFATLGEDLRFGFWRNTIFAIGQYWPAGTGLGTFIPVFVTVEPLESVGRAYVNHAHNDYLELVLETGVLGVLLLVGYAVFLGAALLRRRVGAHAIERKAAAIAILVLLLHSLTDYPLRTASLMCVFGYLNGVLAQSFRPSLVRKSAALVPQ